ncbi:hypothetical protein AB0M91_09300 [Micromonospora rifamycinica]|uniref:hypothetical protein n=1 Tax=Micromonospora rifamycinica TaxID=291594 RepID=UPI00342CD6C0
MRITVSIPSVQAPMLVSNLLGAAGLVGLVVAVGALAGSWWWSVLLGSLFAVVLAYVTHAHAQAAARPVDAGAGEPLHLARSSA